MTVIRFSQDWVDRNATSVLAARSQFNIGIDAFEATINDTGVDGNFFTWQGQFQWLQLSPLIEFGTGWNNHKPDPENATIASLGLGLRWLIDDSLSIRLDYGTPLIDLDNDGESLQDNGLHFSLRYQPF